MKKNLVKVASVQMQPRIGMKEDNVKRSLRFIDKAADQGARLVVLPELCNTGYVFRSNEEVRRLAEPVPGGPTSARWMRKAEERNINIVAGIAELDGDVAYNSAVVVGPKGYVGKYRKIHLWDREKLFFKPGNIGLPIFDFDFGRVGLIICYDGWHPESIRIHALRGADIVCNPTCWVVVPGVIGPKNPISPWIHASQANMNNLFVICADRVGRERGVTFLGHSCVAGPTGFLKGPASFGREEVLVSEIDVGKARDKNWTDLANPIKDRRTDIYAKTLGY